MESALAGRIDLPALFDEQSLTRRARRHPGHPVAGGGVCGACVTKETTAQSDPLPAGSDEEEIQFVREALSEKTRGSETQAADQGSVRIHGDEGFETTMSAPKQGLPVLRSSFDKVSFVDAARGIGLKKGQLRDIRKLCRSNRGVSRFQHHESP
jgi:hypothetical protein